MKSSDIWNELGDTFFKVGEFDKAIDVYCKAIERKSQSAWSYSNLASIYVQQGKYLEAIPLYQKSLELFSNRKDQAAVWSRLGSVYHQLNEHGKAIQAYQKADEMMPNRPVIKFDLSLDRSGVDFLAPIGFAEELEIQESERSSQRNELQKNKLSPSLEGTEIYKNVMNAGKDGYEESATTWNELGLILFKVGAYDDAIEAYQKAIVLDPNFGYFYSNLGQVFIIQGRLSEALENYEKSIKLVPMNKDKAIGWTRLGDIYRQLHQNDEAQAAYQLADALSKSTIVPSTEFRLINLDLLINSHTDKAREMQEIDDLVTSVRNHGIIQPLIVCPAKDQPGKFLLVAGRRRLEAARRVGLKEIPVIIRKVNDQEIFEISINENIHSVALDPFELANGYRQMANDFDLSLEEIAVRVGRSCHSSANTMKALEYVPESTQEKAQIQFHELIQKSLGDVQSEISDIKITGSDLILNANDGLSIQCETDSMPIFAGKEESPTLWYLEGENESTSVMSGEDNFPGNASLLARARHVLKGNPHAKRIWTTPSFRA
jgi:ParB/RepB/Spo0J family partition protein